MEQPHWKRDSPEGEPWQSKAQYDAHWSSTIVEWQRAYQDDWGSLVSQWKSAVDYVEQLPAGVDQTEFDIFAPERAVALERLPYALCGIRQVVSLIFGNYPQPKYLSPNMGFDQYTQALNQCKDIELKANGFGSLAFDLGMDIEYAGWGCLKTYVDTDQSGPFGQKGKIVIQKIDPAKIAVDPKAKRLKWSDLQYVILEEKLDLGAARRMYPGAQIDDDMVGTDKPSRDGMFGKNILSPVSIVGESKSYARKEVRLLECWFKDDRLKFECEEEEVTNFKQIENPDPNSLLMGAPPFVENPEYDPEQDEIYTRPMVDEDGYVVGEWVPAYPDGRCIVLAGDKFVVQDFENPHWHKQAPFVFFRGQPSRKLFSVGDLTQVVKIDKKINDLVTRVHIMAQAEIERPIIADNKALRPPRTVYKLSGTAQSVLIITPGSSFVRMPPGEVPQFPWVLLGRYDAALDMVMAVAGIQRGQLQEGSQLSAESVSSLNNIATGMLKAKAELIAEGMKDLGYQLMWLQRETYDEDIKIPIQMLDGTTQEVQWNEKEAKSDYIVDIESGTGLPGAQAQQATFAMSLWRENLINRKKALQMLRLNDWQTIDAEMKEEETQNIQTNAIGKALGMDMKRLMSIDKKDGAPGRKELS